MRAGITIWIQLVPLVLATCAVTVGANGAPDRPRFEASPAVHPSDGSLLAAAPVGHLNPTLFWAVRHQVGMMFNTTEISLQVQAPFTYIRAGGNCDACNYTSGLTYSSSGVASSLGFNWSSLRSYLNVTHVHLIFCIGGEVNNAGYAANQVRFVEQDEGLIPDYLSIGNEPSAWKHFNRWFTSWQAGDAFTPTKLQYARMVQNYTTAIHGVDSTLKIIGIQAGSGAFTDPAWINQTVAINGPNISAVAIHLYPQGRGTNSVPVSQFFSNISKVGLAVQYEKQNISGACPSCHIPLFIDEFNTYLVPNVDTAWQTGYPQAAYVAAAAAQAIEFNASQFMYFDMVDSTSQALINGTTGQARPAFFVYSQVLSHLNLGEIYSLTLANQPSSVYAVETGDFPRTLLVVNTDTGNPFTLDAPIGVPWDFDPTAWTDDPTNGPQSTVYSSGAVPTSWTIPPMGVLVLANASPLDPPGVFTAGSISAPNFPALAFGVAGFFLVAALIVGDRQRSRPRKGA